MKVFQALGVPESVMTVTSATDPELARAASTVPNRGAGNPANTTDETERKEPCTTGKTGLSQQC
jgi:hypothetical protein